MLFRFHCAVCMFVSKREAAPEKEPLPLLGLEPLLDHGTALHRVDVRNVDTTTTTTKRIHRELEALTWQGGGEGHSQVEGGDGFLGD